MERVAFCGLMLRNEFYTLMLRRRPGKQNAGLMKKPFKMKGFFVARTGIEPVTPP